MQLPQQKARYENCDNNNYTSHRRHTNFFHIKREMCIRDSHHTDNVIIVQILQAEDVNVMAFLLVAVLEGVFAVVISTTFIPSESTAG